MKRSGDNQRLLDLGSAILNACYNPVRGGYFASIMRLSECTDARGDDAGDWVVIVHPSRVPEGRSVGDERDRANWIEAIRVATGQSDPKVEPPEADEELVAEITAMLYDRMHELGGDHERIARAVLDHLAARAGG